jgi:hypothetical protein
MSGGYDPRWNDPRDRDEDPREIEVHWIKLGRGPSDHPADDDPRQRDDDPRERDRDPRDRGHDPPDVFLESLDLPRGLEREIVLDRDHRYELNREDVRTLATTEAFRVVSESRISIAQRRGTRINGQAWACGSSTRQTSCSPGYATARCSFRWCQRTPGVHCCKRFRTPCTSASPTTPL